METNKYKRTSYKVAIVLSKPANVVFHHLTNNVAHFWPEDLEGNCAQLNDEFVFSSGDSHYSKNKIIELVPDKKLVWLVIASLRKPDNFDWTGTKMIFELQPQDSHCLLQFIYDGPVLENEADRLAQICNFVIKENLYHLIESYTTSIIVPHSPEHVFNSIKEVSKWWSKDFEGNSAQLNDSFTIHHPGAHFSKQQLIKVVPRQQISWQVTESKLQWLQHNQQEWTNTKMIFEISRDGNNTKLQFTHLGLIPAKECYTRCEQGWNMVIKERLFEYITTGHSI